MTREEEIKLVASCHIAASNEDFKEYYEGFIEGAKWADKTIIEKACKWLNQELFTDKAEPNRYYDTDVKSLSYDTKEDLLFAFRKAMEE